MPQTTRFSPYRSYEQRPVSVTNQVQEYVNAAGSNYQDVQKSGVGQFLAAHTSILVPVELFVTILVPIRRI
jgi:hypothetical protein